MKRLAVRLKRPESEGAYERVASFTKPASRSFEFETSDGDEEDAEVGKDAGAEAAVVKCFDIEEEEEEGGS